MEVVFAFHGKTFQRWQHFIRFFLFFFPTPLYVESGFFQLMDSNIK